MSIQSSISEQILQIYSDAVVKKVNKDNYLDIHLPSVNDKKGTHLFFNTSKGKIKLGFYCRDEAFVQPIIERSGEVETYSQGIRLNGNPEFSSVDEAIDAAINLISALAGSTPAEKTDTISFNDAINAYLAGKIDIVETYIRQGNPMLQFNDEYLITVELISYVSAFNSLNTHIRNIISKGVNLNDATKDDGCGYTAVHFAVWDNKNDILEYLLNAGANPDVPGSEDGLTALYLASVNGHVESVKTLLKYKADPNSKINGPGTEGLSGFYNEAGGTALRAALVNFHFDIAELLLENGADLSELLLPCSNSGLSTNNFIDVIAELGKNFQKAFNKTKFLEIKQRIEASNTSKLQDKAESQEADESEEDDDRGFPMIRYRRPPEELKDIVNAYFKKWQKPSLVYSGRAGISAFIPEFVAELVSDDVCPIFTVEQINKICSIISGEKVIPILDYTPAELYNHTKRVWWIVPFCIWKDDLASFLFVDKNGFYSIYVQGDDEEIQMIFPWDAVHELEFEYAVGEDDDPNVCRLTLYQENGAYLTFNEFISEGPEGDHGSYLKVIEAIWGARQETIKASKGEPFWVEGAGGETFEVYGHPSELYKSKEDIIAENNREIRSLSNFEEFISFAKANKGKLEIEIIYQGLSEDLKIDHAVLAYMLSSTQNVFSFFPEEIKKDKAFILNWINKTQQWLKKAEEQRAAEPENEDVIKAYEEANKAAGLAPQILVDMDDSLINDEEILAAALSCKYVSFIEKLNAEKWGIDKDWAVNAAKINIHSVHYLPQHLKKDVDVCKALLGVHLSAFNFFTEDMKRNKSVQTFALKKDGYVFQIFPDDLKCNKEFIKSILDNCYDNDDNSGYMIFATCQALEKDQELIDLAVERNPSIFKELFKPSDYTKDVFKHYLKVSPYIFKLVPDAWLNDRDLMTAMLSGGFDGHKRKSLFKESAWYNDEAFALHLVKTSDYSYSLQSLREDFQYKPGIVAAFLEKFPEPEHIAVLPAKQLGVEFFKPLVDQNLDLLYFIRNKVIADNLFENHKAIVLEKVKYADLKFFDRMGSLKENSEVFRAFMQNPLISSIYLEQPGYYIEEDAALMEEIAQLLVHFQQPFFNDRYNKGIDKKGLSFEAKNRDRLEYIQSLSGHETALFKLLLSDPSPKIREEAAKIIALDEAAVNEVMDKGVPIVTHYEYGKSIIVDHKDLFVCKGLLMNPIFEDLSTAIKEKLNSFMNNHKETMENVKRGHVSFKFNHLIDDYDKNETIADMYFDVFEGYENKEITISLGGISEQADVFSRIQEASLIRNGEIFKTVRELYNKCSDYYVEEENIGGETVLQGGEIIFIEKESGVEYNFTIQDIFENFEYHD